MSFIIWDNTLSVNVTEIDVQHKHLVEMINTLHDAVINCEGVGLQEKILIDMVEFANTHFETEEKYMKLFKFQGFDEHHLEHEKFKSKILDLKNLILKHEADITPALLEFLKEWLETHFLDTDQKYIKCFNDNGLH